jgi:hypothetical protein
MRVSFTYGTSNGRGRIVLDRIAGEQVVGTSDGPFTPGLNSGHWVELRDASDRTLFTVVEHQLVPESAEGPGPDGGFMNVPVCPSNGIILLTNLPNDAAATHVVFFGDALDGVADSGPTREIARFALPGF